MWELDYKSGTLKNGCFWTVVLEKTLESPLDCKEIQPVHPKGNQSWIFIGRTEAEAETPILWAPDVKNWLIVKDPDAGKDDGRKRRGWQRMRWLDGIIDLMDVGLSRLREMVRNGEAWRAAVHGVARSWTQLGGWATATWQAPPVCSALDIASDLTAATALPGPTCCDLQPGWENRLAEGEPFPTKVIRGEACIRAQAAGNSAAKCLLSSLESTPVFAKNGQNSF